MGLPDAPDGSDAHMTVNHLGPFLLTRLLARRRRRRRRRHGQRSPEGRGQGRRRALTPRRLRATAPTMALLRPQEPCLGPGSRVVTVSSRAHAWGHLDFSGPGGGPPADAAPPLAPGGWLPAALTPSARLPRWFHQYARSKLCNILMTKSLAARWAGNPALAGASAHAVSPGFVNTGIFDSAPRLASKFLGLLAPFFGRSAAHGADVAWWAATSPAVAGRSGAFWHDRAERTPSPAALDADLGRALWDWSERAVGLRGGR